MGLRTFTFAGTSSSAYSMFITEAATYNVPERAVEMMEVPGRNGAYALDLGRFENVEVTYHVVVHKDTNANFQTELSDVRNWLASKVGYQRLTDDYNSNVYRMAIFKGGLDTDETFVNGAEFDIVFECKPQRWLTSGETAVSVADGGTLDNPTLFDASPLLAVKGYGNIAFNGYSIDIENVPIGEIVLVENQSYSDGASITLDLSNANTGDDIVIDITRLVEQVDVQKSGSYTVSHVSDSITDSNSNFSTYFSSAKPSISGGYTKYKATYYTNVNPLIFKKGTSSTISNSLSGSTTINWGGTSITLTISGTQNVVYDGNATITVSCSYTISSISGYSTVFAAMYYQGVTITVDSTVSLITDTVYIDCDIGECWTVRNSEIVSLNGNIDLGSDLPLLATGTNTFTYDNTITSFKVTPNWWKV